MVRTELNKLFNLMSEYFFIKDNIKYVYLESWYSKVETIQPCWDASHLDGLFGSGRRTFSDLTISLSSKIFKFDLQFNKAMQHGPRG